MGKPLNIIVCGSLVPDPLQTLEPVETPQGPGLKNEQMLPSVLDPWAACALYEAAALAKARAGSKVTLVALGPKAKLQQLMMTVAQKAPFQLVAVNAPAGGFTDAQETAAELAKAIQALPGLDLSSTLLFGGCASASRDAGVTLQFVAEKLGIGEFFMAVDELKLADDDTFTVLERVEGGQYQSSTCAGFPAAIGWATGSLPEPPNNPQTGMMNMRGVMPALMKAPAANVGTGGIAYAKAEVPAAKRDTVVKKDMTADAIAAEIVEWIKQ
ncbi:MAG: electron transfer flavoprotein subunit beta [Kiritimatiellae bacterium]|nr:electron transfer flavoprotein subunit beta [Kiritimatiellia bacterium]